MLILNTIPTRFVTHFLRMMRTLCLNNALRRTMKLQEFIELKLSKEEVTVAIIQDNQ